MGERVSLMIGLRLNYHSAHTNTVDRRKNIASNEIRRDFKYRSFKKLRGK